VSGYATAVDYSPLESAAASSRLELITKLCRRFRSSNGATGLLQLEREWSNQLEQYYASQGMRVGGDGEGGGPQDGSGDEGRDEGCVCV